MCQFSNFTITQSTLSLWYWLILAHLEFLDYIIKIEQEHSYGLAIENFLNETFHAQRNRMRFQKMLEFYIICYMLGVVLRM